MEAKSQQPSQSIDAGAPPPEVENEGGGKVWQTPRSALRFVSFFSFLKIAYFIRIQHFVLASDMCF